MPSPIELDLTLRLPRRRAGPVDLRVSAPPGSTLADLWPCVEELVGSLPMVVTCGGAVLDGSAPLGRPPLVHGASLVVGAGRAAWEPTVAAGPVVASPVDLAVVAGPDAGGRVPLAPEGLTVGRSAGLGLSLADERLSRRHVLVRPTEDGIRVTDLCSTNGTRVGDVVLEPGSSVDVDGATLIAVGDSLLRLVHGAVPVAPTRLRGDGRVGVNRSPRTRPPEARVTVTAPAPPPAPHRGRIPWVAAALPLPFAAVLALVAGPQLLALALLSPLLLVGTVVGDRVGGRREHQRALAEHRVALEQRRTELDTWRLLEREARWRDCPDPATVIALATGPGSRLWERRAGGTDVGRVRLGVGCLSSRTGWAHASGEVEHALLGDVPVEVDLGTARGLGVAGDPACVESVLTHVIGQVAVLHSPRDLQLVVISEDSVAGEGSSSPSWARWLPHTTACGSFETGLETVRRIVLAREVARERGAPVDGPRVLVVLPQADEVGGGELLHLLDRGRDLGVWCLAGARTPAGLPSTCRAVVDLEQGRRGGTARLDVDGAEPVPSFTPDRVPWWWGERLGRSLAPLVDASGAAEDLPTAVDLLDLLPWTDGASPPSAAALAAHWRLGSGRPVGILGRVPDGDWVVDLAADGPHLLVGGTTGSGKSELLRTLVTSLALECSPADLTFVLVDYKGGAAFGGCARLPHTVGLVTNLDEGLARRALTSLRAEIPRRERLLAASGARDVDDHRRRAGGLPRLVIVIDEFRLLADELPDFVDGVVSVAAVGRSLGVHLVLATQRPAGAVTADIQANVNLRIAMRVRDVTDSTDVIDAPDAAHLRSDRPGRGFARGGDGALVEFQAARVGQGVAGGVTRVEVLDARGVPTGAVATAGGAVEDVVPGGADGGHGGDRGEAGDEEGAGTIGAVAGAARDAAALLGLPRPHRPWLPPLPESVGVDEVGPDGVALVDVPAEQQQHPLTRHALDGHWLVAGGARSGRTSCLRTVVAAHLADPALTVHVHAIDTTGELADLEALPRVGTVVAADDVSRVRRLLDHLRTVEDAAATEPGPDRVLLVVDGWERLEHEGDLAVGGLRDELLDLLRSGGHRLRAVVTGDRSLLGSRVGAVASETFVLPLPEPSDATYAGLSPRDLPSSRAPGRAIRLRDRLEVQFARRDPVAETVERRTTRAPEARGPVPFAAPRLPRRVDLGGLLDRHGRLLAGDRSLLAVGVSAETGGLATLDLRSGRRLLVAGPGGSGRSMSLATLALSARAAGREVAVVEWSGGLVGPTVGDAVVVTPWTPHALVDARRAHPDLLVLVDDAESLDGTPVEAVLREIGALVDRDGGALVVATTLAAVATQFRGVVPDVARTRTGLLLCPGLPSDGEPFGIRAPRGLAAVPGRGLLVTGRRTVEVQVAVADGSGGGDPHRPGGGGTGPPGAEHRRPQGR